MIFFRKKKPNSAEPNYPEKTPPTSPSKKKINSSPLLEPKQAMSFQETTPPRVLTAEGWRRSMGKKVSKKLK